MHPPRIPVSHFHGESSVTATPTAGGKCQQTFPVKSTYIIKTLFKGSKINYVILNVSFSEFFVVVAVVFLAHCCQVRKIFKPLNS